MPQRDSAVARASGDPKKIVFAVIGVMTAYILVHNERFLIEPANPVWLQPWRVGSRR